MSGSKVREHLGLMAEVELKLMMIEAFLWTVRHGVVTRLAMDDMLRVLGNAGVPIRAIYGMAS